MANPITVQDAIKQIQLVNNSNGPLVEVSKSPGLANKADMAISNFKNAHILNYQIQNIGPFSHGFILTRSELENMIGPGTSLPADFDALWVCLALYENGSPISVNSQPTGIDNVVFPVISKIVGGNVETDAQGIERRFTIEVPHYIETGGILCPPAPQCPPKNGPK